MMLFCGTNTFITILHRSSSEGLSSDPILIRTGHAITITKKLYKISRRVCGVTGSMV